MYKLHGKLVSTFGTSLRELKILLKFFRSSSLYYMGIVSPSVYACLLIVALHAFQVVTHMSRQVERKIWRWTTNVSFLTTQNTSQNISIQGQIENSNQYHLENYSFQKYRTILFQPFSSMCVNIAIIISSVALKKDVGGQIST